MRSADAVRCRDCHLVVWAGLDAELCGLHVLADTTALDAVGEMLALLQGRTTYELRKRGNRLLLAYRDRWAIRSRPPGGKSLTGSTYVVLAVHRCHAEPLPSAAAAIAKAVARRSVDDHAPPF